MDKTNSRNVRAPHNQLVQDILYIYIFKNVCNKSQLHSEEIKSWLKTREILSLLIKCILLCDNPINITQKICPHNSFILY